MSTTLTREKAVKPQATHTAALKPRPTIVTRAESAPCTCPEHCDRDHTDE